MTITDKASVPALAHSYGTGRFVDRSSSPLGQRMQSAFRDSTISMKSTPTLVPPRPFLWERGLGGEGCILEIDTIPVQLSNRRAAGIERSERTHLIQTKLECGCSRKIPHPRPLSHKNGRGEEILQGVARCKPRKLSPAYSLIELLAVLVIVSLLTAIALPTVRNVLVERKTSVAALEVKAFLEAARARAIARGRPVSVILERLSSRSDDGVNSTTANNAPSAPQDNFDVYNSCIRITMAESLRNADFEVSLAIEPETASLSSLIDSDSRRIVDTDGQVEPGRILSFAPGGGSTFPDLRLPNYIIPGNEIILYTQNDKAYVFEITSKPVFDMSSNKFYFSIRNEGDDDSTTNLVGVFGTLADVNSAAASQSTVRSYVRISSTVDRFSIQPLPTPIVSTVNELPRGSCIDLSLSGLATDDPNVNTTANPYRDCRREFASDWISPATVPTPQNLRPVYLTFSPNGTLQSILCNGPGVNTLRRIEPHSDVLLSIGRVDQVVRAISIAGLATALDQNIKTNLTDETAYWVRISPSSGAIAAVPALTSHILEDIEGFRGGGPDEPIGHLLNDSRSLAFTSEASSQ